MAFRPFRTIKHLLAAFVVLLLLAAGLEIFMQRQRPPATRWVCGQTSAAVQSMLLPSETVHHQLIPSVSQHVKTGDKEVLFRINSRGLRGDAVQVPKPAETYRILVLGDDVIFGSGVAEQDTFSSRLQTLLASQSSVRIEVLNGGVPGDCALLSWLRVEHEFQSLEPDLVLLHFDMTDVTDDAAYRSLLIYPPADDVDEASLASEAVVPVRASPWPETQSSDSSNAPASRKHVPRCPHETVWNPLPSRASKAGVLVEGVRSSAIGAWVLENSLNSLRTSAAVTSALPGRVSPVAWALDHPPDLRIQVRHALQPLMQLKATLQRTQTPLLVMTSPCLWQISSPSRRGPGGLTSDIPGILPLKSRLPFEVLSKYCEQHQIRFLDVSESFRQMEKGTPLFDSETSQMSRLGTALYARQVATFLLQYPPRSWEF